MVISFLTVLFFFLSFFYSGRQEQCCVCMLHLLLYLKFILPYDICIYLFLSLGVSVCYIPCPDCHHCGL